MLVNPYNECINHFNHKNFTCGEKARTVAIAVQFSEKLTLNI